MSLVLQSSGGGQITIQEPATASNFTATLPATTGTLVVTGTTPTLNGITFPATQVPSADANTLDDYEEGTWTPVYTTAGGGESVTYDIQSAKYTKIGNCVYFQFIIRTDVFSGGSGGIRVSLPFTASASSPQVTTYTGEAASWTTNCPTAGYVGSTSAHMTLIRVSGTGSSDITTSNITNSANSNLLNGGGFYYTA